MPRIDTPNQPSRQATTGEDQIVVPLAGGIRFGTDPELFLEKKGEGIIGAEKIIPAEGLKVKPGLGIFSDPASGSSIVLDGVQIELHPNPTTCRANLANELARIFQTLKNHLKTTPDLSASFTGVVEVSQKEMNSLSENSKKLGCLPSKNIYRPTATINVADGHLVRSAGGHIHLGDPIRTFLTDWKNQPGFGKYNLQVLMSKRSPYPPPSHPYLPDREVLLAQILDLCVGNIGVLLDRDPRAAQRRELYGRAGEYRTPKWGFEYRTLSNFWLRSYPLMSHMLGLVRLAFYIIWNQWDPSDLEHGQEVHNKNHWICFNVGETRRFTPWPSYDTLMKRVDLAKVERAINTNDWDLAYENWKILRDFVGKHVPFDLSSTIYSGSVDVFDFYLRKVKEKGIEYWYPEDPMAYWTAHFTEGHQTPGGEKFLENTVRPRMEE